MTEKSTALLLIGECCCDLAGVNVAVYFAFAGYLSHALWVPAIAGMALVASQVMLSQATALRAGHATARHR